MQLTNENNNTEQLYTSQNQDAHILRLCLIMIFSNSS